MRWFEDEMASLLVEDEIIGKKVLLLILQLVLVFDE